MRAGVEDVAPLVENRAVVAAVHRDLAVAVEFAAHDAQSVDARRVHGVDAGALHLIRGIRRCRRRRRGRGCHCHRTGRRRRARSCPRTDRCCRDPSSGIGMLARPHVARLCGNSRRPSEEPITISSPAARRHQRRTVVQQVVAVRQEDRPGPLRAVVGYHVFAVHRAQRIPPDRMHCCGTPARCGRTDRPGGAAACCAAPARLPPDASRAAVRGAASDRASPTPTNRSAARWRPPSGWLRPAARPIRSAAGLDTLAALVDAHHAHGAPLVDRRRRWFRRRRNPCPSARRLLRRRPTAGPDGS